MKGGEWHGDQASPENYPNPLLSSPSIPVAAATLLPNLLRFLKFLKARIALNEKPCKVSVQGNGSRLIAFPPDKICLRKKPALEQLHYPIPRHRPVRITALGTQNVLDFSLRHISKILTQIQGKQSKFSRPLNTA